MENKALEISKYMTNKVEWWKTFCECKNPQYIEVTATGIVNHCILVETL